MSSSLEMTTRSNDTPLQMVFDRARQYKVTDQAARFRDLSVEEKRDEQNLRIGLAVGAAVVAIATIVLVVLASRATATVRTGYYEFAGYSARGRAMWMFIQTGTEVVNIGAIAVVPGVIGTIATVGLAAGAIFTDLEAEKDWNAVDFQQVGVAENEMYFLATSKFEAIAARYDGRSRSVGPLVREGIINQEQGAGLSGLIRNYREQKEIQRAWESRISNEALAKRASFPAYAEVMRQIESAQEKWEAIQQSITENYSQPSDTAPVDEPVDE